MLKDHTPTIVSLDDLISLRTLFTTWDLNWASDHVVLELLRRYNRLAADAGCEQVIMVDIPPATH
jgi:hypothetical protein